MSGLGEWIAMQDTVKKPLRERAADERLFYPACRLRWKEEASLARSRVRGVSLEELFLNDTVLGNYKELHEALCPE